MKILMYHSIPTVCTSPYSVSAERFEQQMRCLVARRCTVTSLELALQHGLPRDWVVLTFDDAYRSVIDNAVPLLVQLGFSATIFVPTGLVGGTNTWDSDQYPEEPIASWDDLRGLSKAGFGLGSHTVSHARLTSLSWVARYREIAQSRAMLADAIGSPPLTFSYPWGSCSPSTAGAVRCAGYRAAVVTDNRGGSPLVPARFRLPRLQIDAADDPDALAAKLW